MDEPTRRTLEVQLAGAPEDGGAVRADDLYRFIQQLLQTLACVEHDLTGDKDTATIYRVVGLSYASPVKIVLQADPNRLISPIRDVGPYVVPRFTSYTRQIARGVEPRGIGHFTLEGYLGLVSGLHKRTPQIQFRSGKQAVHVRQEFRDRVVRLLGQVEQSEGTFRGSLDAVNLHGSMSILSIYPLVGPYKVRCVFPRGRFPNMGALLGQVVDVHGVLKFRRGSPHPFQIEARQIVKLRKTGLPTANQIIGSMPHLTGDLDPVAYLREIRGSEAA